MQLWKEEPAQERLRGPTRWACPASNRECYPLKFYVFFTYYFACSNPRTHVQVCATLCKKPLQLWKEDPAQERLRGPTRWACPASDRECYALKFYVFFTY